MREVEFVWTTDTERGDGFVMAAMPHFDVVRGFGLAHDILEHVDTYAGYEGEAMAFGGIVYIRVDSGWYDEKESSAGRTPNRLDVADMLGHEFADFFNYGDDLNIERITEPALDDEELDEFLKDIARACSKRMQTFAIEQNGEIRAEDKMQMRIAAVTLVHWMRRGFRKVEAFWGAGNPQRMSSLFDDIESTVDIHIKHCDYQHGDRINIRINPDLTWALETLDGMDLSGDYYEGGELANPDDSEEE